MQIEIETMTCLRVITALVLFFGLLAGFSSIICGEWLCESNKLEMNIKPDAMYGGAATIAGLATFGSILGLRFSKTHEEHGAIEQGAMFIVVPTAMLILFQGILMAITCCGVLTQNVFAFILAFSITCLIMAIWGLARILDKSFKNNSASNKDD